MYVQCIYIHSTFLKFLYQTALGVYRNSKFKLLILNLIITNMKNKEIQKGKKFDKALNPHQRDHFFSSSKLKFTQHAHLALKRPPLKFFWNPHIGNLLNHRGHII